MVTFEIADHWLIEGRQAVEVKIDGKTCCVIYPQGGKGIRVISAHFHPEQSVEFDDGTKTVPPIPAYTMKFDPKPYHIVNNQIVRQPNT